MGAKAKIKFKGDITWEEECLLVRKGGFAVFARMGREYMIFEKQKNAWKPEVLIDGQLQPDVQTMLIRRCNAVINTFLEPESHMRSISVRLRNMSLTLPPLQRQFVQEWMDRNLDENQ